MKNILSSLVSPLVRLFVGHVVRVLELIVFFLSFTSDLQDLKITSPSAIGSDDIKRWILSHNYSSSDIVHSPDGLVIGATLPALVEKLTPHDSVVDPELSKIFFLTFRLFTTPNDVLAELVRRFDMQPPADLTMSPSEMVVWKESRVVPAQLRIYQLIKTWLDTHWRFDTDQTILEDLRLFTQSSVVKALPNLAPRLISSIEARSVPPSEEENHPSSNSAQRTLVISPNGGPPTPIIHRSLFNLLKSPTATISITDLDPLELARQLTLLEFNLFNAIKPENLFELDKKQSPALTEMSTFHTQVFVPVHHSSFFFCLFLNQFVTATVSFRNPFSTKRISRDEQRYSNRLSNSLLVSLPRHPLSAFISQTFSMVSCSRFI